MLDTPTQPAGPTRRQLLRVGLLGSAALATAGLAASLSGCSARTPQAGFAVIRASDLPMLQALIPVLLEGAVPPQKMPQALAGTLESLDYSLAHLSPEMRDLTLQLFDVLALPVTRGPLTGVWGRWQNASTSEVRAFLARWQNSTFGLLQMGHASLLQLVLMSWYGRPESWAHCGYPGPPSV
ncbi:twin-arginine translocation pathway signal protein [Pseudomonas benzenivorans]|uniref:Twin-arginine translocation pathway signal protein n=1 Tax=Pseudomonas benzenivorans TaxID=556533 RepID=A0ABZ0PVI0_9PSED|nr:twin-arginine translocation pathway signal protein [Pseudomonas benzenivorans]WPC04911.1 twin-arginine translocation pathway signal protein [Pseudomonas benzenivorans]